MLRMSLALILSVIAVLLTGNPFIRFLKYQGMRQTMYELGPQEHMHKQGTPIMGGFLFIYASVLLGFLLHKDSFDPRFDFTIAMTIFTLGTMMIGFVDDFIISYKHRNLGLTAMQKLIAQTVFAVGFSVYCYFNENIGSAVHIPYTTIYWDLGIFYIPLMSLTIIFIVNSANLQDGMDGLLTSVSNMTFIAFGLIALTFLQKYSITISPSASNAYLNIATFSFALAGGCMGFLRFNYYPAKVFMGDTGSMFLGASAVAVAMVLRVPFLLLLIFFTPIMSSVSVIIQRIYFKATGGKRIFKMSPIHHHFEKSGMSEPQVVMMYTITTTILSLLAILSVYGITTSVL